MKVKKKNKKRKKKADDRIFESASAEPALPVSPLSAILSWAKTSAFKESSDFIKMAAANIRQATSGFLVLVSKKKNFFFWMLRKNKDI